MSGAARRSAFHIAAVVAALWLSIGCGDDADDGPVPLPCDIRELRCRVSVLAATARIRGQPQAALPPSRIITRAQFADETRVALAMQMSSREARIGESALRLLHFLPRDVSLDEAIAESDISGVAAYYESDSRTVTIIDDAARDASDGTFTLSHEYVHALQDQREGLDALWSEVETTDEDLAISSLVEGEATVLSDVVMASGPYRGDELARYLDRLLSSFLVDIEQSDSPFHEALSVLPYPVGARPLGAAYVQAGMAGIAGFYTRTPRTFSGWVDSDRSSLPEPLSCESPDAPPGYEQLGLDSLGSAGLLALYTRVGLTGEQAFAAARAWSADAYALFGPLSGDDMASALAWRIRIRDELSAADLETKLRTSTLGMAVERRGRELIVTAASQPELMAAWTQRNECSTSKGRTARAPLFPRLGRYLRSLAR